MIRELAENANTYTLLGPDEERVVDPRYVISLGARSPKNRVSVVRSSFESTRADAPGPHRA